MSEQQTEAGSNTTFSGMGILKTVVNGGIAVLSVGVIIGFAYWAINLGLRDPRDVPIIRAMEGPPRVAPENPGGSQASHQGLAVNTVQSDGGVEDPTHTVVLAPEAPQLAPEDAAPGQVAGKPQAVTAENKSPAPSAPDTKQSQADVIALEIANQVASHLADGMSKNGRSVADSSNNSPGRSYAPASSPRPRLRPDTLVINLKRDQGTEETFPRPAVAVSGSVPAGTELIQLGAYDSLAEAELEWAKLWAKHEYLLEDTTPLIVPAQSGGRQFYRLRLAGFDSLNESRALCSTLSAAGTICVTVTAR